MEMVQREDTLELIALFVAGGLNGCQRINNMTYELAKQLKDAGFPQGEWTHQRKVEGMNGYESYFVPTLSELIEACGDEFMHLERNTDSDTDEIYWVAYAVTPEKGSLGSTPEEAVAKLWLELNKK